MSSTLNSTISTSTSDISASCTGQNHMQVQTQTPLSPLLPSTPVRPGVTVVLGSQWGDEGKGKLVDVLAQDIDVCARCQGGNNAGHTIVVNGTKFDFHLLPSGLINPACVNIVGNGVVVHLPSFFEEVETTVSKGIKVAGRLFLSSRAHLVFDFHQIVDGLKEDELGRGSIGTTKKGIGPAYSSKASRSGLRVHHLFDFEEFESRFRQMVANKMKRYGNFDYDVDAEIARYREYSKRLPDYVIDSIKFMHDQIIAGKRILVEGANALMLDLDLGTYPFVTSSNTNIGGVCTGLGLPPNKIGKVIGVAKAYTTRVGAGPFPTEQLNVNTCKTSAKNLGTTTGRKRRCGWLDTVVLQYSTMINGYNSLNLTKLDILDGLDEVKIGVAYHYNGQKLDSFPADLSLLAKVEVEYEVLPGWKSDISKCRKYEDLPLNAQKYVTRVEQLTGVPVEWIGVGVARDAMVYRPL
ncbi:hypothetical protein BASA60_011215 [Batrachochytrium salamandrivorans]|nr:hypothetical protein BASA60_011215 [Batrachochytrium salamandrivorans]